MNALCRIATLSLLLLAPFGARAATCPALLNHQFNKLQDGSPQSMCQYAGKVVLVVNTASKCGFTPQYDGLEKLYRQYQAKGLVVIGFPSNDFGEQEPGSDKEIAEFCRLTYGVQFPMMSKTDIAAPKTHAFYKQLIAKTDAAPKWNFHKYLIDRSGTQVESFGSRVAPESGALIAAIEKRLAESAPK
jgi:glutathione peroxidase